MMKREIAVIPGILVQPNIGPFICKTNTTADEEDFPLLEFQHCDVCLPVITPVLCLAHSNSKQLNNIQQVI